jgi:hypothetical protein
VKGEDLLHLNGMSKARRTGKLRLVYPTVTFGWAGEFEWGGLKPVFSISVFSFQWATDSSVSPEAALGSPIETSPVSGSSEVSLAH